MRTIYVAEARRRLSEMTRRIAFGGERVVVERHGACGCERYPSGSTLLGSSLCSPVTRSNSLS